MPPRPKPLAKSSATTTYLALLRGINVGGKNILPMQRLTDVFTAAGCAHVRTYIQSGNVVFTAPSGAADRISKSVAEAIAKRFKIAVPVIIRTADELAQVAAANPFLKSELDTAFLHVAFLADAPEDHRIKALDPKRSPGDTFKASNREIYLHLTNGVGKTKITNAYLDSALATTSTLRNWRTVLKLLEMTQSPA